MKMTRREFLNISTAAAVVCAATLLPVEKAAAAQQTLAAQNLLEQAYLYAFPLVIMDATRTASTNTRTATSNKAPINQFIHAESWQMQRPVWWLRRMWIPSIRRRFWMSAQNQ